MRYEFNVKNIKFGKHRIVEKPSRKFRAGDVVIITNNDDRKDIYKVVPATGYCTGCCLYNVVDDKSCLRWKTYKDSHSCILTYRRRHSDGCLVFQDVSAALEEL